MAQQLTPWSFPDSPATPLPAFHGRRPCAFFCTVVVLLFILLLQARLATDAGASFALWGHGYFLLLQVMVQDV